MGNFSISHYAGLRIGERSVELVYILDLAEIPTFQEIQETGIVADPGHPSVVRFAADKAEALKEGLHAQVGGGGWRGRRGEARSSSRRARVACRR